MNEKLVGDNGGEISDDLMTFKISDMLEGVRANKELQVKAFGKELTDDEFASRFSDGISAEDIYAIARARGLGASEEIPVGLKIELNLSEVDLNKLIEEKKKEIEALELLRNIEER